MALRWAGTGFRLLPKGGREQLINNHLVLSPLLHLQLMRLPLSAFLAGWRRRHCRARGVLGRWYPPQAPGSHLLPPSALRHLREATSGGPSGAVLLDFCDQDFESALSGALSASSSGAAPQPSEDPWGSSSSPPCAAGPQRRRQLLQRRPTVASPRRCGPRQRQRPGPTVPQGLIGRPGPHRRHTPLCRLLPQPR